MKLLLDKIKTVCDFDKASIYTICIENKKFYVDIVNEFIACLNGESDKDILYNDDKTLVISKNAIFIDSILSLDFGTTKLMNALYESLKTKIQNTELEDEYRELVKRLTLFYDKVQEESDFSIEWKNDVALLSLLKLAGYSFNVYGDNGSLHQLLDYMHIYRDALGIKLFVFMNAKLMFEDAELKLFYEQCNREDIKILNLDVILTPKIADVEKLIIVDKDLCEIS